MDGRDAFVQEAAALGGAPLDADAADGFPVVPGLPDGLGELHRQVDGEVFRQRSTKRKKTSLSKNIWVMMQSAPASTFCFR